MTCRKSAVDVLVHQYSCALKAQFNILETSVSAFKSIIFSSAPASNKLSDMLVYAKIPITYHLNLIVPIKVLASPGVLTWTMFCATALAC